MQMTVRIFELKQSKSRIPRVILAESGRILTTFHIPDITIIVGASREGAFLESRSLLRTIRSIFYVYSAASYRIRIGHIGKLR